MCDSTRPYSRDVGGTDTDEEGTRQITLAPGGSSALACNDLMEQICRRENLNRAYKKVKANKGAPGIDGMTVDDLSSYIRDHKAELLRSLLDGSYQPTTVRGVKIPKPNGGERQLGIPTVLDRLIQQAIIQVLDPIFDAGFSKSSYGFRRNRSAHMAVRSASELVKQGYEWVVDIDLEKFFDRVNHDILMSRIARVVQDRRLLKIIRRFLTAGIMEDGIQRARSEGTPQGGPLSPLLSNILLDELDKELERRGHQFCRYADDCNIYVKSQRAGERVMGSIREYLWVRLKLKVNVRKSKVVRANESEFLGYTIQQEGKLRVSEESRERMRKKVRVLTKRSRGRAFEVVIKELNRYLIGWFGYFKLTAREREFSEVSSFVRQRLRCYRLKQCKTISGIIRFLQGQGIPTQSAWLVGQASRGWYRKSRMITVSRAMSNEWFRKDSGLVDLEARYAMLTA